MKIPTNNHSCNSEHAHTNPLYQSHESYYLHFALQCSSKRLAHSAGQGTAAKWTTCKEVLDFSAGRFSARAQWKLLPCKCAPVQ